MAITIESDDTTIENCFSNIRIDDPPKIAGCQTITSLCNSSSEKSLEEVVLRQLVDKAKSTYSEIYKKEYMYFEAYSSFLSEIRTLVMNNNAELRFYDNSVRFDFTKGNNIFIIEYSREDDFLTITKKSEKNLVIKECVLGEINQVLDSLVNEGS